MREETSLSKLLRDAGHRCPENSSTHDLGTSGASFPACPAAALLASLVSTLPLKSPSNSVPAGISLIVLTGSLPQRVCARIHSCVILGFCGHIQHLRAGKGSKNELVQLCTSQVRELGLERARDLHKTTELVAAKSGLQPRSSPLPCSDSF